MQKNQGGDIKSEFFTLTLRLTPSMKEKLFRYCYDNEMTVSELIRKLVRVFLKHKKED